MFYTKPLLSQHEADAWVRVAAQAAKLDRQADAHLFERRTALAEHFSRRAADLRFSAEMPR